MDWQTLLTGFVGALGGTATALLIAGTLGKGLLDQWLKKDFKRFESKLDALASRDETKFENRYGEGAAAVKEIYPLCREAIRTFNSYVTVSTMCESNPTSILLIKRKELSDKLLKLTLGISTLSSDRSIYLTQNMGQALINFTNYLLLNSALESYADDTLIVGIQDELANRLSMVHYLFEGFLGCIDIPKGIEKSLPG